MIELKDYSCMAPVLVYDLDAWENIIDGCPLQTFKAGSLMRMQGAEEKDILIAKEGFYSVSVLLDDGTETIQHIGGPGCMFGYISASTGSSYMSTARAYTDCTCYIISGREAQTLLKHNQNFMLNALRIENLQSDIYFKRICLLAVPHLNLRILQLLLGFAAIVGRQKRENVVKIRLELTHQMLSDILHVNRVTISRQMSELGKLGAVMKNGKYYELHLTVIEKILERYS